MTYPNTIDLVREFHETFDHPVASDLTVGDAKLRRLRVLLIAQELGELAQALGVELNLDVRHARDGDNPKRVMNDMYAGEWVAQAEHCYPDDKVDMVETADALGDLDYVVQGGNLVFGIPAGLVMCHPTQGIHSSNMSKLGADGKPLRDADGKVMKGPNFREPDIKAILDEFDPRVEL